MLNEKGMELYNRMEENYCKELARLQEEKNDPNYEEGWTIIDNEDYVKTFEDEIALLIYGYVDYIFDVIDDWYRCYGNDLRFFEFDGKYYSVADFFNESRTCYTFTDKLNFTSFKDDTEKMLDFYELTKEEFLLSYSYLTEEEYDLTFREVYGK